MTATDPQQRNVYDQNIGQYFSWICHSKASGCPCWAQAAMKALSIFLPWVQLEDARVETAVKYTIALVQNAAVAVSSSSGSNGQNNTDSPTSRVIDQAITGFSQLCSRCARTLATPSALEWMLSSLDARSVMTLSTSSRVRLTEALCGVIARSESTAIARQCVEKVLSITLQRLAAHAANSFAEDGRIDTAALGEVAADFCVVSAALTRMQYVKPTSIEERRLVSIMTETVWPILVRVGTCIGNIADPAIRATVAATDALPSLCQLSSVVVRTNGGQIDQYFSANNIVSLLGMMGQIFVVYRHPNTLQPLGVVVSFFGSQPQWFEPLLTSLTSVINSVNGSGGGGSSGSGGSGGSGGSSAAAATLDDPELTSATMTLIQQYTTRCPATLKHGTVIGLLLGFSIQALASSQVETSTAAVRYFALLAHTSRRQSLLLPTSHTNGVATLSTCVVAQGKPLLHALLHGIGHRLPLDCVRRAVDTLALWNAPFRQEFVAWTNQIISDASFVSVTKLDLKGRNSFVLGLSTLGDAWSGSGEQTGCVDARVMEEYRQLVFTFAGQCRGESIQTVESS